MLLGWVWQRWGKLWVCILVHALMNLVYLILVSSKPLVWFSEAACKQASTLPLSDCPNLGPVSLRCWQAWAFTPWSSCASLALWLFTHGLSARVCG